MSLSFVNLCYLVSAVLFIGGIKGLTRPRTAVRGNLMAAIGMLLAVVVTLLDQSILSYGWILTGAILGAAIGVLLATRIQMTAMPQMVALLNGFGGGASLAVAVASFLSTSGPVAASGIVGLTAIGLTVLIGAVTLTGSAVAFGKLQELLPGSPMGFKGITLFNGALLVAALAIVATLAAGHGGKAKHVRKMSSKAPTLKPNSCVFSETGFLRKSSIM